MCVARALPGLTAVLRAAELGLRVTVLERGEGDEYLCNSRWSGGNIHMGMDNPCADAAYLQSHIEHLTLGLPNQDLAPVFAQTATKAVDWLRGHGVRFMRLGEHPGRQWIMVPPRRGQPGLDWKGPGPDDTLKRLAAKLKERGGVLRKNTRAVELVMDNGHCVGVRVESNDGTETLNARAVVIADGGFQGNKELVRRFVSPNPDNLMQRNAGTGRGDGLKMAEAVGAKLVGTDCFYGHPLSREAFDNEKL